MSHFVAESIGHLRGQPGEGIPLFEAQMSVDDHAALPALGQRGAALRELQVPALALEANERHGLYFGYVRLFPPENGKVPHPRTARLISTK